MELANIIESFVTELLDLVFGFLQSLFGGLSSVFGGINI